jgi:hypothetical protein
MLIFKSINDLSQVSSTHSARNIIRKLMHGLVTGSGYYDPEADGYVVLIEKGDVDRVIHEIWPDRMLVDVPWEGVHLERDHYVAVWLADNQFSLVAVIPEDAVTAELRSVLEGNLVPLTADHFD